MQIESSTMNMLVVRRMVFLIYTTSHKNCFPEQNQLACIEKLVIYIFIANQRTSTSC